jgi:hypothetical protein
MASQFEDALGGNSQANVAAVYAAIQNFKTELIRTVVAIKGVAFVKDIIGVDDLINAFTPTYADRMAQSAAMMKAGDYGSAAQAAWQARELAGTDATLRGNAEKAGAEADAARGYGNLPALNDPYGGG